MIRQNLQRTTFQCWFAMTKTCENLALTYKQLHLLCPQDLWNLPGTALLSGFQNSKVTCISEYFSKFFTLTFHMWFFMPIFTPQTTKSAAHTWYGNTCLETPLLNFMEPSMDVLYWFIVAKFTNYVLTGCHPGMNTLIWYKWHVDIRLSMMGCQ